MCKDDAAEKKRIDLTEHQNHPTKKRQAGKRLLRKCITIAQCLEWTFQSSSVSGGTSAKLPAFCGNNNDNHYSLIHLEHTQNWPQYHLIRHIRRYGAGCLRRNLCQRAQPSENEPQPEPKCVIVAIIRFGIGFGVPSVFVRVYSYEHAPNAHN